MCSCAAFNEASFSTEIDIPASVCCGVAIHLLFSIQFLVQPCSSPIGSLDPLSPLSGSYGRVLRCLWQSPEEGVAFGVGLWNRGYCHISPIQYDTNDGWTLRSWCVGKWLSLALVSYLHALHGTRRTSVRTP